MNWSCEQIELHLSDYIDQALHPNDRRLFDAHVNSCAQCTALVSSVSRLVTRMQIMEQVEPPSQLVEAILNNTIGPRKPAPRWLGAFGWIRAIASIRFAYGTLSVAATVIVLLTASGFSWRKPKLADLSPVSVYRNADRQAHLVYARGTKFVSDLRVVYEIQSRLRQEDVIPPRQQNAIPQSSPEKDHGRTEGAPPNSPKQQNRANDVAPSLPTFTACFLSPSLGKFALLSAPLSLSAAAGLSSFGRRPR
jgi:anti-sigma factor RsiW